MRSACSSLSMTHGPAMKARGSPPPIASRASIATRRTGAGPASAGGLPEPLAGIDEAPEQRVRLHRLRLELGVELAGEEVRVVLDLDDLHEPVIRSLTGHLEPPPLQIVHVLEMDLVTVAVPLADLGAAVRLVGDRARLEQARPAAEPHVAAHPLDPLQLPQLVDDRVRRGGIELRGIRLLEVTHVAGVLYVGALHSEADAEEGDAPLAGEPDRLDHALDAADPEAPGHEDAVSRRHLLLDPAFRQPVGLDPVQLDADIVGDAAVRQRLVQTLVG